MNAIKETVDRARHFCDEVGTEIKKTSWPTRQEVMASTIAVIMAVVLLSLYIGVSDKILISLLRLIIRTGS